jgi:hypothetical protein
VEEKVHFVRSSILSRTLACAHQASHLQVRKSPRIDTVTSTRPCLFLTLLPTCKLQTSHFLNVSKYHVSCTAGKISVTIKIGISLHVIFRLRRQPMQIFEFVPVGLSSFLIHLRQVLLGVV